MNSSVTTWIGFLKEGQDKAAQELWGRYFPQLLKLAGDRIRGLPQADADEEDLALSAFQVFCRAATNGQLPDLNNRDDLWRILVLITVGKAVDRRRYVLAQKRGGQDGCGKTDLELMEEVVGREVDPGLAALLADECQALLRQLKDDDLERMALLKLGGATHEEISGQMKCSVRTVKRRLALIRRIWEQMSVDSDA